MRATDTGAGTVPARRHGPIGARAPARRRRRGRRRRRRPVRGADGRGRGRASRAREPLAACADRVLLGPGRHRRRAGGRRRAGPPRRRHARGRARRRPRERGAGALRGVARRGCATWSSSACASTPTAAATSPWGSRAATRAGASSTRAAPPRAGGSPASCRRWRRYTSASRCSSRRRRPRYCATEGRCVGLIARRRGGEGAGAARARRDPRHRRHGRAVGAHDQPARRGRRRPVPGRGGRRRAGRPRVHAVPPHRAPARRAARRLPHHRGRARRGRHAAERRGRPLRGRARAARPGGARDPGRAGAQRRARGGPRRARRRSPALPQHRRRARGGGARPGARPAARGARRPLHDGRRGERPRRALVAGGPVRGRRVRPAPASTAPTGSPPIRSPNASCSAGARRSPRRPIRRPRGTRRMPSTWRSDRPRRPLARRFGATRACAATRPGCGSCSPTRTRSPGSIAASCLAREESRGAHQRTDAPATDPALDCMHTLVDAGAEPRFERWT